MDMLPLSAQALVLFLWYSGSQPVITHSFAPASLCLIVLPRFCILLTGFGLCLSVPASVAAIHWDSSGDKLGLRVIPRYKKIPTTQNPYTVQVLIDNIHSAYIVLDPIVQSLLFREEVWTLCLVFPTSSFYYSTTKFFNAQSANLVNLTS